MKRPSFFAVLIKVLADYLALWLAFAGGFALASTVTQLVWGVPYLELASPNVFNHAVIFGGFGLIVLLAFYGNGHYTQRLPWWHQVKDIVTTLAFAMLIQGFVHYVLKYPLSRMWVGFAWVLAMPLVMVARLAVRAVLRKMGRWSIPTMIIGGESNALEVAYALHSDAYADYALREMVLLSGNSIDPDRLPQRFRNVKMSTGMEAATACLARPRGYLVLAPDEECLKPSEELMDRLQEAGVDYGVVPPMLKVSLYDAPPRYFFGHNVVMFNPNRVRERPISRIAKRLLDVVGAFFGLLLLSPLFVLIAVLIKRENRKSKVFFGHKRVGRGGKMFSCYKFTSMVPNAQQVLEQLLAEDPEARAKWQKDFKLKNDPRITRIGRILRKTSLDELPQLWNVLKGNMSLVGPRPIVKDETAYYGDKLPFYLASKPGVTGLWQVSGRNDTSYDYRVYLDTWYAKHWSVWHDIVILLETVKIVFSRAGAY